MELSYIWKGSASKVPTHILSLKNVIYKFTSPSGKSYIGQTTNLKVRFGQYKSMRKVDLGSAIHNAMVKYGLDNFEFSILATFKTKNLLNAAESIAIWKEKTLRPLGYNLNTGGDSFTSSEETRAKLSICMKKRWDVMTLKEREAACAHLPHGSGESNNFYGKKHTEEAKKKMAKFGEDNHWTGKRKTMEWKLKFKASNKRIHVDEELPLYVSLLRGKRGGIVVRVQKPNYRKREFGDQTIYLSERIKMAKEYLESLK